MYSVPVKCETHGGFGELQGILRLDNDRFVLQYQTADSLLGLLRSAPRELVFPIDGLVQARYRSGWFGLAPAIELRMSEFSDVAQLALGEAGRLRLRVRWSDRRDARDLVDGLAALCAERRYLRLDAEIRQMASSHPLAKRTSTERVGVPSQSPRREHESE